MVCGDGEDTPFRYRSGPQLTDFFKDIGTGYVHRGESRNPWATGVLRELIEAAPPSLHSPPDIFLHIVKSLMDKVDATEGDPDRAAALKILNATMSRDGLEGFYGDDGVCYLRNTRTNTVATPTPNPHRPLTPEWRSATTSLHISTSVLRII